MIAMPNKADAPNQAMTIWLESKHLWHACWTPSARSASSRALEMSVVASVTFTFDGTEKEFQRLYDAIADIDLDIAAYSRGTTGV